MYEILIFNNNNNMPRNMNLKNRIKISYRLKRFYKNRISDRFLN